MKRVGEGGGSNSKCCLHYKCLILFAKCYLLDAKCKLLNADCKLIEYACTYYVFILLINPTYCKIMNILNILSRISLKFLVPFFYNTHLAISI